MEDKIDIALKRIEQIKKEIEGKIGQEFKDLDFLIKLLFQLIYTSKQVSIHALKDSTLMRYFMYDKKMIDSQEYVNYCKNHPSAQNFNQEIQIYQDILQDIESDDYKNPRNHSFMETKKQFRQLELAQIQVNRMKLLIERLEKLQGQDKTVEDLKKAAKELEGQIQKLMQENLSSKKKEEKEAITKKEDATKIINEYWEKNKNNFIERYRYLPIFDITTHLEPYIKQLYFEAKELYWLGRYNACIIICCVLLEAMLKDIIKLKEGKQKVEMEFEEVIKHCKEKGYIDETYKKWLIEVKDRFRNPYLHANLEQILPHIMVPGVAIGTSNPDVQIITTQTIPTLRDIQKPEFDREQSLVLFKEVHKFVKKMSEEHFDYTKDISKVQK